MMKISKPFNQVVKEEERKDPSLKKELPLGTKLVKIGMLIQIYRHKHHLTQVQLAKLAHMPQSSIARIENGDNVNMKSLFKIAHAMHQPMTIKISA